MSYNDKQRAISMVDVDSFDISLEAIMDCPECFKFLIQFLRETHNSENANFLLDIVEFRSIRHEKKRRDKAEMMIKMYVNEKSKYELNINNHIRQNISMTHCRRNMFDELENAVVSGLMEQVFPLFLKSKLFSKFISISNLYILYEIGSVKKSSLLYYIDGLSELKDTYVNRDDVDFILSQGIQDQPGWELVGSSQHHSCWFSSDTYSIGESNRLNFFKYYVTIDADYMTVMSTFKENSLRKLLDKNLVSITDIDYLLPQKEGQLFTAITREEYKIVYPCSNREFIVSTSCMHIGEKIVIVMKTSDYPVQYKKDVIRCPSIGGWIFEKRGNKTEYCQFHYIDFKGKVPKKLMKLVIKARAKQFYTKSKEVIDMFCVTSNDNNIGRTLADNSTISY